MYSRPCLYKKAIDQYIEYSEYKGPNINIAGNSVHTKSTENYEPSNISPIVQPKNTSNPQIWGPPFWFTIHNGMSKYPISASQIQKERMQGFILGIPTMLPCEICKVHATNYIEEARRNNTLDTICSGRDSLFKWSVDFHNSVNKRYNKKELSYDEAYKLYN
jgi:hypothetical protein